MKYFVIHSGNDLKEVKECMARWSQESENIHFVILEGNQPNWVGDAVARIRECSKVLYLVGENSAKSENIQQELNIAAKENKDVYVYKLNDSFEINECLLSHTLTEKGSTDGEILITKTKDRIYHLSEGELIYRLRIDSHEIDTLLMGASFDDKATLMEQYKMFVQTSEDLVSRKQSVNTFYVTINSVMLSAIVSIICAVGDILQFAHNRMAIYIISCFLSVVGMVICCSWITLLISYADLNASKMAIISCIEERLALKLYDTEWALLTRRIGNKTYQSFTVKELSVAKIFLGLYLLVALSCILLCVMLSFA